MDVYNEVAQKLNDATEKGREEGRKAEKFAVAKNLLKLNVSIDIIFKTTGLSIAEVEQLK